MAEYNIQLEQLCETLRLGKIVSEPVQMTDGAGASKVFGVATTAGNFVIKALSPKTYKDSDISRIENSEEIALLAGASNITSVPAKKFTGKFVQMLDGQAYLIYDWIDGYALEPGKSTLAHYEKIGQLLAQIHATDFGNTSINIDSSSQILAIRDIRWKTFLQKGKAIEAGWYDKLQKNFNLLKEIYSSATKYDFILNSLEKVISHSDITRNNVLWRNNIPYVIDWMLSKPVNPNFDFIYTCFCWVVEGNHDLAFERECVIAFAKGYAKYRKLDLIDWKIPLNVMSIKYLRGLELRLKNSLKATSLGKTYRFESEVEQRIDIVVSWHKKIHLWEEWLEEAFEKPTDFFKQNYDTVLNVFDMAVEDYKEISLKCDKLQWERNKLLAKTAKERKELVAELEKGLEHYLQPHGSFKRIFVLFLIDRKLFKEKMQLKLHAHPWLLKIFSSIFRL